MYRRTLVWIIFFCLLHSTVTAVNAEFSTGSTGQFKDRTQAASALLNEALAAYHHFQANIDLKNPEDAKRLKTEAVAKLRQAASAYDDCVSSASVRVLTPTPLTTQDKIGIQQFNFGVKRYGIHSPITQISLVQDVKRILNDFANRLDETKEQALIDNLDVQQLLANDATLLEQFLLSVTTVLRVG
jgi:uncharacterized protein YpbB